MSRRNIVGQQRNILEGIDIEADLEVEWSVVDGQPEVDSVYMLLVNRTNVNGRVINTIDRINVTYYIGHALETIKLRLYEDFIYEN